MKIRALNLAIAATVIVTTSACSTGDKKRSAPEPQVQAAVAQYPIKQTPRGEVLTVDDVLFEFDRAELNSNSAGVIQQAAKHLQKNPSMRAVVEGHADDTGAPDYNQILSENRSTSVKQALIDAGVSPSRIDSKGYGESKPVASNDSSEGRQANRRVEILFPN